MPTWELTNEEIAYIAGIVDGEGHLGISKSGPSSKYNQYTVKLTITNSNMLLINWLVDKIGKIYISAKNGRGSFNKKVSYNCLIQGNRAVDFIRVLYPYLIVKKSKADLLLKKWPAKDVTDNATRGEVYNRMKQLTKEN